MVPELNQYSYIRYSVKSISKNVNDETRPQLGKMKTTTTQRILHSAGFCRIMHGYGLGLGLGLVAIDIFKIHIFRHPF